MNLYSELPHADSTFIFMSKSLKFCPELDTSNAQHATEQLMNALVINNRNNITKAVKAVIKAKYVFTHYCHELDVIGLAEKICKETLGGVFLKPYAFAANLNRSFNTQKLFSSYTQRQAFINLEFKTDYMLKFNGHEINYQKSFFIMIEELMFKRENNNNHNAGDELIYQNIHPKCDELRSNSRVIIRNELKKFNAEYERKLNYVR